MYSFKFDNSVFNTPNHDAVFNYLEPFMVRKPVLYSQIPKLDRQTVEKAIRLGGRELSDLPVRSVEELGFNTIDDLLRNRFNEENGVWFVLLVGDERVLVDMEGMDEVRYAVVIV